MLSKCFVFSVLLKSLLKISLHLDPGSLDSRAPRLMAIRVRSEQASYEGKTP